MAIFEGVTGSKDKNERNMEDLQTVTKFPCSHKNFPFVPLFPKSPGGSLNMEYHHPLLTEHDYISRIIAFAECINGINGQP